LGITWKEKSPAWSKWILWLKQASTISRMCQDAISKTMRIITRYIEHTKGDLDIVKSIYLGLRCFVAAIDGNFSRIFLVVQICKACVWKITFDLFWLMKILHTWQNASFRHIIERLYANLEGNYIVFLQLIRNNLSSYSILQMHNRWYLRFIYTGRYSHFGWHHKNIRNIPKYVEKWRIIQLLSSNQAHCVQFE
jgi:hypothetical protein